MKKPFGLKRGGGTVHLLGTRGETVIHRLALETALHDALAADPETAGLALPPEFEIQPTWEGHLRVQLGSVDLVANSETVTHAWNVAAPHVVRPAELHDVVQLARLAMRRAAQATADNPPPAWTVMVHPVALALVLGHDPDRTRYPLSVRAGAHPQAHVWKVDSEGRPMLPSGETTAVADCWLGEDRVLHIRNLGVIAPRTMSALTFTAPSTSVATLSIPGQLPDVIRDSLAGRRLGEVFELPSSPYPDVDAAAHACRIAGYEDLANGVCLHFGKVDHVPYGEAPDEATARAMRLAPPHL